MSAQPRTPEPASRSAPYTGSIGTIVVGGILILIGLAWILDVLDVVDLSVSLVLPAALILVGIALLAGSVTGTHGGLVALGIILTVVLAFSSIVNVPLSGGVGDKNQVLTAASGLKDSYELMIGDLSIDATELAIPLGETTVDARVGIGQLTIDVPSDVAVMVHWTVVAGSVEALGKTRDGANLDDRVQTPGYDLSPRKLIVEASMGFGDIKVRQP